MGGFAAPIVESCHSPFGSGGTFVGTLSAITCSEWSRASSAGSSTVAPPPCAGLLASPSSAPWMVLWSEMYATLKPAAVCHARFSAVVNRRLASHEWFVWL